MIAEFSSRNWAIVLAGGEGTRLRHLTSLPGGNWVPKQFCSLCGGASLLHHAIERAAHVAPLHRICVIVTARHRPWWSQQLAFLPEDNVIVQPDNRGTAHGILLPLLSIAERDPDARVAVLPADHHVAAESVMATCLRSALDSISDADRDVHLLGMEPRSLDTQLGYIVPERQQIEGSSPVKRFVEKPSESQALELLAGGALWNAFILAANVRALLSLFGHDYDAVIARMLSWLTVGSGYPHGLGESDRYRGISVRDFSRDVLAGRERQLRVWRVPECGWSDLGTPERLAAALRTTEADPQRHLPFAQDSAVLSLARYRPQAH